MRSLLWITLLLPFITLAQKKKITFDDIYKNGTFTAERVQGFTDPGLSSRFDPKDGKDESGNQLKFENQLANSDQKYIIFLSGREAIYRHSSRSTAYVYDVATKKTVRLNAGKVLHPTFSPDGKKVAYVLENNLYLYDIASGETKAITTDGKWNHIINGNADWVYE